MAKILTLVSGGARSMDVLSRHVLVVQADNVPVVSADVSLLVLVGALESLKIVQLCRGVRRGRTGPVGCTVLSSSMNTWELFRRLSARWTTASWRGGAVHAQLLSHIAHVLRRPEVLEDVLHVLIVVRPCAWATAQGSLVVQAAMRSLDAHVSDASWRDEVEAELARFHELHVAEATAVTTTHLLLARHDCGVAVDAVRVRLSVMSRVHAAMLACNWPQELAVSLSWTFRRKKDMVSIMNCLVKMRFIFNIRRQLTALQVPQPHCVHAPLWVLSGHVQASALALATMDIGARHASVRQLHVATSSGTRRSSLSRAGSWPRRLSGTRVDAILSEIYTAKRKKNKHTLATTNCCVCIDCI
jgi:hypothetical protein